MPETVGACPLFDGQCGASSVLDGVGCVIHSHSPLHTSVPSIDTIHMEPTNVYNSVSSTTSCVGYAQLVPFGSGSIIEAMELARLGNQTSYVCEQNAWHDVRVM